MSHSKPVSDRWFVTEKIHEGLYRINEVHYWEWNRANLWLIRGETQDLLVDTGLGVASLRQHLAQLIDKPLLAIASHVHFDHAGGIHEFDRIAIHAAEASALRAGEADAANDRGGAWRWESRLRERASVTTKTTR